MFKSLRFRLARWLLPESSLEVNATQRGFGVIDFLDANQEACSLQKSSSAMADHIWLGVDKLQVKKLINGKWQDVTPQGDVVGVNRMHLSQLQVQMLLPYLIKFVESGVIE